MTDNQIPSPTFAVTPVIDYEPPPRAVGHRPPASPARRRAPRTPHWPAQRPAEVASPTLRAAAVFADAALRRVLEVIDRRRSRAQLRPLLTAGLVESVRSMSPATAGTASAAILRRVRIQAVGPDAAPTAAEIFGTYTRGRRTHALACRIEPTSGDDKLQWQVVALHIG